MKPCKDGEIRKKQTETYRKKTILEITEAEESDANALLVNQFTNIVVRLWYHENRHSYYWLNITLKKFLKHSWKRLDLL